MKYPNIEQLQNLCFEAGDQHNLEVNQAKAVRLVLTQFNVPSALQACVALLGTKRVETFTMERGKGERKRVITVNYLFTGDTNKITLCFIADPLVNKPDGYRVISSGDLYRTYR